MKHYFLKLLLITCVLSSAISLKAQEAVMKVNFDLTTEVSYSIDPADEELIDEYHKISLLPFIKNEQYEELIYPSGVSTITIYHQYPLGLEEDWLFKPYKTVIDSMKTIVYDENNEIYFEKDRIQHPDFPAIDFTAYYYASPQMDLLSEDDIAILEENGFVVEENSFDRIIISSETESHFYSPNLLIYEFTEFENGIETHKKTIGYTPGMHNDLVYDFIIERETMDVDSICVEKVILEDYSNLIRTFYDPIYSPLGNQNPGGTKTSLNEKSQIKTDLLISQNGQQNEIILQWDYNETQNIEINLYDMFGKLLLDNISLSKGNNTFSLPQEISTGVYIIRPTNSDFSSKKFVYRKF